MPVSTATIIPANQAAAPTPTANAARRAWRPLVKATAMNAMTSAKGTSPNGPIDDGNSAQRHRGGSEEAPDGLGRRGSLDGDPLVVVRAHGRVAAVRVVRA